MNEGDRNNDTGPLVWMLCVVLALYLLWHT